MRKLGKMKDTENVRVGIYMRPELRDRIDQYAMRTGLTRSNAISFLCQSYLDRIQLNNSIVALSEYVDSGVTSESEALERLLEAAKKAVN